MKYHQWWLFKLDGFKQNFYWYWGNVTFRQDLFPLVDMTCTLGIGFGHLWEQKFKDNFGADMDLISRYYVHGGWLKGLGHDLW